MRVTRLEKRVDDWQTVLNGHTNTLNAIREDVVDQGKRLVKVEAEVTDLRSDVTNLRSDVTDLRSEMRNGFGKLAKGQELITDLLTRHLGEPDEEPRAGGTGE